MLRDLKFIDFLAASVIFGYFAMQAVYEISNCVESASMQSGLSNAVMLVLAYYFGASKKQD